MHHEEDGVEPGLSRLTETRVDELVLGDEEAGEERERDVDAQIGDRAGACHREPPVTGDGRQRVERVPDALPAGQGPSLVKPPLVHQHGRCLHGRGNEQDQGRHPTFSKRAPQTVSPGPNARLTTGVPAGVPSSARTRIHTCGNVADDMLP